MLRKQKREGRGLGFRRSELLFQGFAPRQTRGTRATKPFATRNSFRFRPPSPPPFPICYLRLQRRTRETKLAGPRQNPRTELFPLCNRLASAPENFSSDREPKQKRNKGYKNTYRCELNFTRLSILTLSFFFFPFVENHECQERVHFLSPPVASNGVKLSGWNSWAQLGK